MSTFDTQGKSAHTPPGKPTATGIGIRQALLITEEAER